MKRKYEIAVISKGAFARTVRIYSPKHADRAIIMHDGQNVFCDDDASYKKSWRALDILKECGIKNTAVIGVDSTASRLDDYIPFKTELSDFGVPTSGGKADVYMDFIEQTLVPYLDKRFGYKFYGMLGSSAGACATLCFAERKHPRFKAYGLFSAPLFLCKDAYSLSLKTASFDPSAYYYVYSGGSERVGEIADEKALAAVPQLFVDDAVTITNVIRKSNAVNLWLRIDNTAIHDETCWRAPEKKFFEMFANIRP